ncbi:MAG: type IX secretion system protein PorQ [Chitinophagales bacterium]|nr:type IX secretion system protein PorQ [Bacteroidota bacterium]MCB9043828.1 type IX secretion system protein PorQ [Chitinophagales bacterium]
MKKGILLVLGLLSSTFFATLQAQYTQASYAFLQLERSAQTAAMGGKQYALANGSLANIYDNPAALQASQHHNLYVNAINYLADITHGNLLYARNIDSLWQIAGGLSYLNYGKFERTLDNGESAGEFSGSDKMLSIFGSRSWKNYHFGVQLKALFSNIDTYTSSILATDWGIMYSDTSTALSLGLVVKNVGFVIDPYATSRETLPFDLAFSLSKTLEHLPFRYAITVHHLHKWDIRFAPPEDETDLIFIDDNNTNKNYFGDKLMRHFTFGGELFPDKAFNLRFGYNHLRRKELSLNNVRYLNGYTFGFGIKVRQFKFDYTFAPYHQAAATHLFALQVALGEF